jgi:hypothetical protein
MRRADLLERRGILNDHEKIVTLAGIKVFESSLCRGPRAVP